MVAAKGHKYNKGKKNARKLKTPELMQKVYDDYCEHIAQGYTKRSWYYDQDGLMLTAKSMENYIQNEPNNFPSYKREVAFNKGMKYWESVVNASAQGLNKDANTATLQMLMRNKYGWDKENSSQKESNEPLVKKIAKKWRGNSND